MIKSIKILDPISASNERGIEVDIELHDGSKRWCYFITPEGAKNFGDLLGDTNVRLHYGVKHMILVSEISEKIIHDFLDERVENNQLLDCTTPF